MTKQLRNVAIIAHVDHGKTTLVDALLTQTQTVKSEGANLIMDSGDLEKERGITITAKNCSLDWNDYRINIIDTPGHADFGGEVERTLRMADGALLLVDAKEGPMPQTKFVLKKALELGHKVIVVINKIDKPDAQVNEVIDKTFDLFVRLNATDEQLEFPILYASGINGVAHTDHATLLKALQAGGKFPNEQFNITPVFESIVKNIKAPEADTTKPFALQVLALFSDTYKGTLGIGKILSGKVKKGDQMLKVGNDDSKNTGKVSHLLSYQGLVRVDTDEAFAGDIVAIGGFTNVQIGDVFTSPTEPVTLPKVSIEEPTIRMTFGVNTSPFAGREGKLVTSRNIRDRLFKELETNVALKVEEQGSDNFLVSGRGELHLAVLIETMRREGFELQVSQPQVIYHEKDGKTLEPYETVTIDVPNEYQGTVIEELGKRGGDLQIMDATPGGELHTEYILPTRGLIGLKSLLLTRTRGTAIINNLFDSYREVKTMQVKSNEHGSLIASEAGVSSGYGLSSAQERGTLFIGPQHEVYEGMVVGQNALDSDLEVNVCRAKKLTNMRSSGADDAIILTPPKIMTLDLALEYISSDELVEVTPQTVRIRKRYLTLNERKRNK